MKRNLYVIVSLVAIVGLLLAACQKSKQTPTTEAVATKPVTAPTNTVAAVVPTAAPAVAKDPPMLAERVAKGELPPLEQRLPDKPLVVVDGTLSFQGSIPDFSLGEYGGTMRSTHLGGFNVPFFYVQVEPIVTGPEISLEGAYPNVVEGYKVSDDYTTFTFTLRKGLKWSDGELVTMDDVKFVFEDLYFNKEYSPNLLPWLVSGDDAKTPVKFEVLDDFNFRLTYAGPKGSLTKEIALAGAWNSWDLMIRPMHYLKQWHPKYSNIDTALKDNNFTAAEWPQLLDLNTCVRWDYGTMAKRCLGYPGLGPYIMVDVTQEGATWERNPYYWKVDAAGRQLPYIDKWVSVFTPDSQTAQTIALGGELDILSEVDLLKAALFMEKGKEIGFDLVTTTRFHADGIAFFINGCVKDPVMRSLYDDIRFRQAMNFAMNRQEIIDNVYLGFGQIPEWIMPSEYSPDKANALLDEIGMTQRGSDGYRLSSDGKPVTIIMEYGIGWPVPGLQKSSELFAEHLKAVGLNTEVRPGDGAVVNDRLKAGDAQITVWNTFTPKDEDALWSNLPSDGLIWCQDWTWLESSGKPRPAGMPDEFVKYEWAIQERTKYEARSAQDKPLYEDVKAFYSDYYWVLISVGDIRAPMWVNGKLGNITRDNIQAGALRALEIAYWKK
jgi:peptide/nickel transport system substrate-binding protein